MLYNDDQSLGINNRADTEGKAERFGINYEYNLETWYFHLLFIFRRVKKEYAFVINSLRSGIVRP